MAIDYTDDEIREELARLGYKDVTGDQLQVFKKNLMKLIHSERKKITSQKSFTGKQETSGMSSNYGNPWLQNNYDKQWLNEDPGDSTSYPLSVKDFGSRPTIANTYDTYNQYHEVATDRMGYGVTPDMHNLPLKNASSEPNLKTKMVKWKLSREETNDDILSDTTLDRPGSFDIAGQYDKSKIDKRENFQARRDNNDQIIRPASADTETRHGPREVDRKMPGIITRKEHPHTRNLVRTKPFERHQMYLRVWRAQPPIGEACRSTVCRQVHKQMLKKEEIKIPQKTLTPNSYVVPTTKPRYELRWAIRQCNENYELPPCGLFHKV